MSKLRHIAQAATAVTVGAIALLVATSLSAAQDRVRSSPTPMINPTVAQPQDSPVKREKQVTAQRMRDQRASMHKAQPSAATGKEHRLILQVNTNDPAAMNLALNNAANVTQYYRDIKEQVKIEVITFGPGLNMLREDTSPVKSRIETMALGMPEISFKACGNTQENMHKSEGKDIPIIQQAQVVKSGVVRVMELQEEGWTYVKP